MDEFFPGDGFEHSRFLYHEAGHVLALLCMGFVPERAEVFTVSTKVKETWCYGFVESNPTLDKLPMPTRAIFAIAGVAAEEWAVASNLLKLRPRPSHPERADCRGYYSRDVYTRNGHGYMNVQPKLQKVVAARVESDIDIVSGWIDLHRLCFDAIVTALSHGPLDATECETLWLEHFGAKATKIM